MIVEINCAGFQKKCLGKMKDVSSKEGRTVMFVSHNMGAIQKLCHKVLVLEFGSVKIDGTSEYVIDNICAKSNVARVKRGPSIFLSSYMAFREGCLNGK